jgi:hypothetical protein
VRQVLVLRARKQENHALVRCVANVLEDLAPRADVNTVGRLVHEENLRLRREPLPE